MTTVWIDRCWKFLSGYEFLPNKKFLVDSMNIIILNSWQKERDLCLTSFYIQCGIKQNSVRRWYTYRASTSDCVIMLLKILSSATIRWVWPLQYEKFSLNWTRIDLIFFFFFNKIFDQYFMSYWRPCIIFVLYAFLFYNLSKHVLEIFCPK